MSRLDPPAERCAALPSWSRTASCLKSPGHKPPHRSAPQPWDDRREWTDEPAERAAP